MSTYDTTPGSQPGHGGTDPDSATGTTQEKTQEAAQVAQEKAQEVKGAARDRVRAEVDTRSTQAGEQAATVAQDVRSVGEHLRGEGKDKPAELADKAAERVAQIGDYLKRSDGDAILRDAERLGREKPWAVMAGGIALGIAASRFLKASSSRRYQEMESSPQLPARRADVDRAAISPPAGRPTGATAPATPSPANPTPATQAPVGDATTRPPSAPEGELSLTAGVRPPQQHGPGAGSRG